MKAATILFWRVRGFRVIDLGATVVVLALALTVYAFKTSAGAERTDIADIEDRIADERAEVRLLRDQVSRLENPARLEDRASRFGGLAPIAAKQEVTADALPQVAGPTTLVAPAVAANASDAAKPAALTNEAAALGGPQ